MMMMMMMMLMKLHKLSIHNHSNSTIKYIQIDENLFEVEIVCENERDVSKQQIEKENEIKKNFDGLFREFDNYKNNICRLIKIDVKKMLLHQKVKKDISKTISIHFRIGDYKKYTDIYQKQNKISGFNLLAGNLLNDFYDIM